MLSKLTWPTAAVLIVVVIAIAATLLAGPSLGWTGEDLAKLLATEGGIGAVLLALMRSLLGGGGGGPTAGGGIAGALLALVIGASTLTTACGGAPREARIALEQLARGTDVADVAVAEYVRTDGERARAQVRREIAEGAIADLVAAMARFEELIAGSTLARDAVRGVRQALLTAEAALDAWDAGASGAGFFASAACILGSVAHLAEVLDTAGVPLPAEMLSAVQLLGGVARGACPDPRLVPATTGGA